MNKERRKRLKDAVEKIYEAIAIIEEVRDDEETARDNLPENLMNSQKWEDMEEMVDALNDHIDSLEDRASELEEITEG